MWLKLFLAGIKARKGLAGFDPKFRMDFDGKREETLEESGKIIDKLKKSGPEIGQNQYVFQKIGIRLSGNLIGQFLHLTW